MAEIQVAIIDYGCGNLTSLVEAFKRIEVRAEVTSDPVTVSSRRALVLPGVGNFGHASEVLQRSTVGDAILSAVDSGSHLLGICLGMQLLVDWSEESGEAMRGLGLIPGVVRSIRGQGVRGRVPHVGWNDLAFLDQSHAMARRVPPDADVYFVHGYSVVAEDPEDVVATTDCEVEVVAAIARGRVWGTQFHPEKSSAVGLQILRNFVGQI
jgi:glutamine amidotransferase